uniref:AlNc14C73G4950 protein n=1 Tax=Albugo laibachii Nc14 TaxID=890382 RepID=F0WE93_9STRA|nr:AlNc14C73G4950 [Albugo laibachii Nc14]|eukprot:CCA19524.1 AlNc14C73G4950 [Albugo laibachii Nc14]
MVVGLHCKKQTAVALSTAEAEYVVASIGGNELLGLKELAGELGLQVALPMCMNMDNQAAIKQVENEASSSQAKHVDLTSVIRDSRDLANRIPPLFITQNGESFYINHFPSTSLTLLNLIG